MRPLPRLHAVTDPAALDDPAFGVRAAAIAAAGPAVALHLRRRPATAAELERPARRLLALARPPEAAVIINRWPQLAERVGAHGVQLGQDDGPLAPARARLTRGWIGRSVHSLAEAEAAIGEGADYLLLGAIYPTTTHPDQPAIGLELLARVAQLGRPVIAIGGVTPARVPELRAAGAWGVAAIRALWHVDDSAEAARALLAAWDD